MAMERMSYLEWSKIKHIVDVHYEGMAAKYNMKIVLDSHEDLLKEYKRSF